MTHLKSNDLNIKWNLSNEFIDKQLKRIWKNAKDILLSSQSHPKSKRINIRDWCDQKMYDFKRNPTLTELNSNEVYGGLPLIDERRKNKKTYGITNSEYIGFMDNNSPVRIKEDKHGRMSTKPDRIWFRLDSAFADVNKTRCINGPLAVKGYCAYDLNSAKQTFLWFAITKAVNGRYPIWANQLDLWAPNIIKKKAKYFYSLCFAYGLAENRCVVTKFEKDNPVEGAPEVLVDNPLCPINPDSFWSTILDKEILKRPKDNLALQLVKLVKQLYKLWNKKYCESDYIYGKGLQDEPYFKYFDYEAFLTPYSGLIQIKKYAELENLPDINDLISQITAKSKQIRDEIYKILVEDFKYFE